MSNLEKWIRAILNEDADNLSMGSVRTLQMIKHEFERLQKENERLASQFQPTGMRGEWRLCPKCLGDGNLARYNSPPMSTNAAPTCDVCYGAKRIVRPLTPPTQGNEDRFERGEKQSL